MTKSLRFTSTLIACAIVITDLGCVEPTNTSNRNSNSNINSNAPAVPQPSPAPTSASSATSNQPSLTLPLLDAFFSEEKFAEDLKSKLQLTDEQINKLKTISRQQTLKLRENDNVDAGRATAARDEAYQQSKAAIGEEKTRELVAFVNERWSGSDNASATTNVTAAGLPQDTRIVVNTPAFRMDVFEDGKLVKTYKIGIGYPEFPLPKGLRKADTIIFNPTWTPPDEPWVESANSKVKVGEKVAAGDKLNPLGPIKIPIGLPSLIHGGKAPAKLGGFASHGCVGLTSRQVEAFARQLAQLSGTQLSEEQITAYEKDKTETKPVKLKSAVPVELRYDTITVEDGKLHIYRDVYDRGTNTEENLRSVLQQYGVNFDQFADVKRAEVMKGLSQMARDASGKPASETDSPRGKSSSTTVTRTIKGSKEIVIDIPQLAGKGYPAPVDLDDGGASKKAGPRSRRRR